MAKNDKPAARRTTGDPGAAKNSNAASSGNQDNNQAMASTAGQEPFSNPGASQTSTEQVSKTELPGAAGEPVTGQTLQAEVSGAASDDDHERKHIARAAMMGIHAIKVSAPHDGYRRAGRPWTRSVTHVSLDELTDEQLKHLTEDSRLIVTPVRGAHAQDAE